MHLFETVSLVQDMLQQNQIRFTYLLYRAWCSEMMARITADDLPQDVAAAEALINRHKEHKAEIDSREKDFTKFTTTGQDLIKDGHFLATEVCLSFRSDLS